MIDNFRRDVEKAGYRFEEAIIADNNWHRCYFGQEKKSSGRYRVMMVDDKFAIGNFGSDKDPEGFRAWHNRMGNKQFSAEEKRDYMQKVAAEKKRLTDEREAKQERLSRRLDKLYSKFREADAGNDYLYKKKIGTHGLKIRKNKRGVEELIIPLYQIDGQVWNYQRITNSWKGFIAGAKVLGGFFRFPGDQSAGSPVIICEGFATAASVYQATGLNTFAVFSTSNLEPVARILKANYPSNPIIFCADNDAWTTNAKNIPWNPGLDKAQQAASAIGGAKVIWPEFQDSSSKPTDFNDLHVLEGLEAVRLRVEEALPPPKPAQETQPIPFEDSAPAEPEISNEPPQSSYYESRETEWPFQILGHNEGLYYFLPRRAFQVVELSASSMANMANLFRLAPMDFWKENFGGDKKNSTSRKIAEFAANALIEKAHLTGIFNSTKTRGVGAWLDEKRVVIHAGNKLIVDGEETSLQNIDSSYIYPLRATSFPVGATPLPAKEAVRLREICGRLSWENKLSGELLAGWIVIAPICGALSWRPHIWIEGESESGKTTIIEKIVAPLMEGASMRYDGGTTEAGVRQLLGIDALPIIYDEAEPENQRDRQIMEGLLLLARRSSKGGIVGKGGSGGKGESYIMRSCFCFAGINPAIKQRADESRISRLVIRKANFEDNEQYFRDLKKEITSTFTKEYAQGLLARTIKLLPTIIRNCEMFTDAAAEELANRRAADQIGVLLAGLYSLTSPKLVAFDEAIEFIRRHQWTQHTAIEENKDHERLISYLSAARVKYKNQDKFLGEIIEIAWKELRNKNLDPDAQAEKFLRFMGIWPRDDGIWIINKSSNLESVFRGTPWESNWSGQLRSVPGAEIRAPHMFATGITGRSICVPYKTFDIDDAGYTGNLKL